MGWTAVGLAALDFSTLPQQVVNGVLLGAIYALIALGYTMVYGILRLINFAHGEVFMLGAYTALFTSWKLGYSPEEMMRAPKPSSIGILLLMLVASMVVCAVVGALIEFLAYRPMRNQPRIAALITAIGVSLFLQYGGALFLPVSPPPAIREEVNPFPSAYKVWLRAPQQPLLGRYEAAESKLERARQDLREEQFKLGSGQTDQARLDAKQDAVSAAQTELGELDRQVEPVSTRLILPHGLLIMLGTSVFLMLVLRWLVMSTKIGRAMRAVSHDFDSASLMGVNVNTVVVTTFLIGSALAGAGAMMYATFQNLTISTFFGVQPGLKAFVAAVLGGIGNIPGAVLGGVLMGVAEQVVSWFGLTAYRDAVAFVILIVVLLFRPGGLLGSSKVEKV